VSSTKWREQTRVVQNDAYALDCNGTYVITGAFGGLGVEVVRWLASKGAKNLILLSRSGPRSESARKLVVDLQEMGITLATPTCNVTDAEDVSRAVREGQEGMPPIRGCLHLAVSGKVSIGAHMQKP
jgi:NAD(P)-dependent dehydrogenase (short-subunit alcohol dehydrogenase family)